MCFCTSLFYKVADSIEFCKSELWKRIYNSMAPMIWWAAVGFSDFNKTDFQNGKSQLVGEKKHIWDGESYVQGTMNQDESGESKVDMSSTIKSRGSLVAISDKKQRHLQCNPNIMQVWANVGISWSGARRHASPWRHIPASLPPR